jgi:acetyl esterase
MSELHPQAKQLLEQLGHASEPPTLEQERAIYESIRGMSGEPEAIAELQDMLIMRDTRSIPIRIYKPSTKPNLPIVVYCHGGSFIGGSLNSHDPSVRALANASGCLFVVVDYVLAPEHPFDAGLQDVLQVVRWLAENAHSIGADAKRIALAGDSAGGALATLSAYHLRQLVKFQLLFYPNTDLALTSTSWHTYDGIILTKLGMAENVKRYLDTQDPKSPSISPLYITDLSGAPAAWIAIGTHDPLIDEVSAYAQRLEQSGTATTLVVYDGMIHGFLQMQGILDDGKRLIQEAGEILRQTLAV